MRHGLLVRLRPNGPWRVGSDTGARDETADLFHSDSLYSAISHAMARLGEMEAWFAATAQGEGMPAVRFGSCYPWQDDDLFVIPPRTVWPPATATLLRLRQATFLPLRLVASLLGGETLDEEQWSVASHSRCLVRSQERQHGTPAGPYQITMRAHAPVDRMHRTSAHALTTACFEFRPNSGLWFAAAFRDDDARERWSGPVKAAIRLLADSGFGGRRSIGWGRSDDPEIREGGLPALVLPEFSVSAPPPATAAAGGEPAPAVQTGYWLLSLYRPAAEDTVDWNRGDYSLLVRGGRTDSPQESGGEKKLLRMVGEGSVLMAASEPVGSAADVRAEGGPHPVYRFGCPISIPIPVGAAV
jgi:CRISPR type III-A-associated RAMP protein Csm4